jgi:hypothetical protein
MNKYWSVYRGLVLMCFCIAGITILGTGFGMDNTVSRIFVPILGLVGE